MIKAILLSLWLGAALFFSATVAPAAFGILRQFDPANASEMAGRIVSRTLAVVNVSGFFLGLVILIVTLFFTKRRNWLFGLQIGSLLVLTAATAIGQWIVAARMVSLRAALSVPISQIAEDDGRRLAFNQLHGYSVTFLSAAMLCAIISIVLDAVRGR